MRRAGSVRALFCAACLYSSNTFADSADEGRWGSVELIEELRLGELEGPEEFIFGRVSAVAIGADLSTYVADNQLILIRRYSFAGTFLGNLGAKGQGPGEYSEIMGMKARPDGSLVVLDRPHRVILFDKEGNYGSNFTVPSTLYTFRMLEIDNRGAIYVKATHGDVSPNQPEMGMAFLKLAGDGQVLDRIPVPRRDANGHAFVLVTPEGPQTNFLVSTCSAWSPLGYFVVGRNDAYVLKAVAPDGEVLMSLQRQLERVRLSSEEREEWTAWGEYLHGRRPSSFGPAPSPSEIPRMKPYFKNLHVGDDGRIWVQRYVAGEKRDVPARQPGDKRPLLSWRERSTFDVFESNGDFLGSVTIPQDMALHAMQGMYLWGVQATDEGEQLVRMRMQPNEQ